MADIFLVRSSTEAGVDRYMVLKRVLAARARDPVFAQLFLDEARLAAQLQHPNIAQVYDVGKLGGSFFFSMEYVHGEDLRAVLRHSVNRKIRLPVNIALYVASSAAAALHHAHERTNPEGEKLGIVHRDVSPSNIMISYEGGIKMIDFGVAKAAQKTVTTNTNGVKGKSGYMSPEQIRGDVDRRSDIFSLGIVLHEMLTSKRLFKRENDYLSMAAVVHEDVAPPSKLRPDLSPEIDRIVATALARDPERRYPTAAAMLEDIEAVATVERHLLSANAMSKFMRDQFGIKPEPWHALRDSLGEQLTIESEAVPEENGTLTSIPIELELVDELAGAPLLRPQVDPSLQTPFPTPTPVPAAPTDLILRETSSFTPAPSYPAIGVDVPALAPRRKPLVIAGTAVVAFCLALGVAMLAGVFDSETPATASSESRSPAVAAAAPDQPPAQQPPGPPTNQRAPADVPDQPPGSAADAPAAAAIEHVTLEIEITGVKEAVVRVDGGERTRGKSVKLELPPGPHDIVVEAAGRASVTKHVELVAGRSTVLSIAMSPPARVRPSRPSAAPPRAKKDPCKDREYVKANPLECQ